MRTAELRKAQHGVPTVKKEEVLGEELEERGLAIGGKFFFLFCWNKL